MLTSPDALGLSPPLVWGLLSRGLGMVFVVAFLSLAGQVRPIAGARGITPIATLLAAIRRDFPGPRRWLDSPTLLWLSSADTTLVALPWLGALAGVSILVGGPHVPWAFLACYLLYLSLDRAMTLVYPWDSLLLEAGFWAMFLPATGFGAWASIGVPSPELAWVFRLLIARVIFGFGKQKFLGSTTADSAFLHGFLIRQPLPTKLGWWMHHAPLALLKFALLLLFIVEVVLPFLVFAPGNPTLVFAGACAALMLAIAATGNFGCFNLLTLVLLLPCLDNLTPAQFSFSGLMDPGRTPAEQVLLVAIAVHTVGAVILLPLNTWASFTWTLWPFWRRLPRVVTWPLALFRALQPLRWLHAYGVFPPRSGPAIRLAPRLEVKHHDTWECWAPRYFPVHETSAPRLVAPHHPRVDQAIIYESVGFTEASVLRGLTGRLDPYGHSRLSGAGAVMRGVLHGTIDHDFFFGETPGRHKDPPEEVRMRLAMLEPTSIGEMRATGRFWHATHIGPHYSPMTRDSDAFDPVPPPPELWHFEDIVWLRRSRLGPLMQRVRRGNPHALVIEAMEGARGDDVRLFWQELVPMLNSSQTDLSELVARVRARFDLAKRRRLERIAGRYGAFLIEALEPAFLAGGLRALLGLRPAPLDVKNHTHLGQLAHAIVLEGREIYERVLAQPDLAGAYLSDGVPVRGSLLRAVFRHESVVHQARLFRMLKTQTNVQGRPPKSARATRLATFGAGVARRLWGAFDEVDRLAELETPQDPEMPEQWPSFRMRADRSFERIHTQPRSE